MMENSQLETQLNLISLSFSEAIAFTQTWLERLESELEKNELNDSQILVDLAELLSHSNGVRGFFVAYLTGESPLADQPPDIFLEVFRANSVNVSSMLVKNLAMSTAMAIAHQRNNDPEQQRGSETVQRRSAQLLRNLCDVDGQENGENSLKKPFEHERLALLNTIHTKTGEYADFLLRWQYDEEQCKAIKAVLESITSS
jgi:hypothetical protein